MQILHINCSLELYFLFELSYFTKLNGLAIGTRQVLAKILMKELISSLFYADGTIFAFGRTNNTLEIINSDDTKFQCTMEKEQDN